MIKKRWALIGLVSPILAVGIGAAAAASADPIGVTCSIDGQTLTCPLPSPQTVTQTTTVERTVTAPPVTVTETKTVTSSSVSSTVESTPPPASTDITSSSSTTTTTEKSTSTSVATTTPASSWPGASNTGVPAGIDLVAYAGPCRVTTAGTVIDGKTINCPTGLAIAASNVIVKNSKVNGRVIVDTDTNQSWSLTLQDSEVDGGPYNLPTITNGNVLVVRANLYGGHNGVECQEHSSYCIVRDSWIHGQYIPAGSDWHLGGILVSGGTNIQLIHNRVHCEPPATSVDGGCTGDINILPDFGVVSGVLVDSNLLMASTGLSYCTYGGNLKLGSDHVVYRNNVFERGSNGKCGAYGPVTGFNINGIGNEWTNNVWDDGSPLRPVN